MQAMAIPNSQINRAEQANAPARKRLNLKPLLAPFAAMGSMLASLMRLVRAIVMRIARAFGVAAKVNSPDSFADDGVDQAEAHFEAASALPEDVAAVEAAAKQAQEEVELSLTDLLKSRPSSALLAGPGAEAYLGLRLSELGNALQALREKIDLHAHDVDVFTTKMGLATGLSSESLRAHLMSADASNPEFERDYPPEVLKLVGTMKDLQEQQCKLQLRFCDFARVAVAAENSNLQAVLHAKVDEFADDNMRHAIFQASIAEPVTQVASAPESPVVVSVPSVVDSAAIAEPAKPRSVVSRFLNRSAGIVPDEVPAEPFEPEGESRDRQRG